VLGFLAGVDYYHKKGGGHDRIILDGLALFGFYLVFFFLCYYFLPPFTDRRSELGSLWAIPRRNLLPARFDDTLYDYDDFSDDEAGGKRAHAHHRQMCGVAVMGGYTVHEFEYIHSGALYEVLSAGYIFLFSGLLPGLALDGSGFVWRVDRLMYGKGRGRGCCWWWMVVVFVCTYRPPASRGGDGDCQ
jgi:hypothetical protein